MPRAKADNVVIHRIEFGGKERELLEGATAAWQFNRVASPIIAALSDVSFLVFVGGVLAAYKFIDEDDWKLSLVLTMKPAPQPQKWPPESREPMNLQRGKRERLESGLRAS